ncbi:hypothetical protein [Nonomuraea sp. SBT364]|uniref:hypothetical protein n=1 Tax=Nonomuraea sp. SBT364 TaxID=1580530 RepID=UPI003FA53583
MRHGTASLALACGSDLRVVQGTLGHGSIVVTSDIYISVLPEVYHRSAQAIARLILGKTRAGPPATFGRRRHDQVTQV